MPGIAQLFTVLRPTVLVALGAILAAGVAPVMAGAYPDAQVTTTTQTRSASCNGLNFHPIDSTTSYDYVQWQHGDLLDGRGLRLLGL